MADIFSSDLLHLYRLLMIQLEKKQSEVRLTTLLVMDELFHRSHCFRSLLLSSQHEFDSFLDLIGLSCSTSVSLLAPNDGLPPPAEARKLLKKTAISVLDKWNRAFASGYRILSSACNFLSQQRGVCFNEQTVRPNHVTAAEAEVQEKRKMQLKQRVDQACVRFEELSQEIRSTLRQADEAMELLIPKQDQTFRLTDDNDGNDEVSDWSQEKEKELNDSQSTDHNHNHSDSDDGNVLQEHGIRKDMQIGIHLNPLELQIRETSDNRDIIENITDQYKLLIRDHLPKLRILMKRMSLAVEFCEETLKRAIDLKNNSLICISKISELGILNPKSGESDSKGNHSNDEDSDEDDDDFVEVEEKEGLQLVIPQHERHLYGLTEERDGEKSRSGNENSEVRSCRAPLPSGKLCPRRDLRKCPFHGIIVDRDPTGLPVSQEDREREEQMRANRVPEWQDPAFLKDLEAVTGMDLTVNRHKRKRKSNVKSESEVAKVKNPKERLMQRIFAKESRLKVARDMDEADAANHKQYEDNWSYALNT